MTGQPAWNQGGAPATGLSAQLPAGATVKSGLFSSPLGWASDLTSGTANTLLVAGEAGGQSRLYLSFLINAGLNSTPFLDASGVPDGAFTELVRTGASGAAEAALAVFDIDGDHGPDLFTPGGFFPSHCPVAGGGELCSVLFASMPPQPQIALDYTLAEGADPGDAWAGDSLHHSGHRKDGQDGSAHGDHGYPAAGRDHPR
jgi:hypothetical protein